VHGILYTDDKFRYYNEKMCYESTTEQVKVAPRSGSAVARSSPVSCSSGSDDRGGTSNSSSNLPEPPEEDVVSQLHETRPTTTTPSLWLPHRVPVEQDMMAYTPDLLTVFQQQEKQPPPPQPLHGNNENGGDNNEDDDDVPPYSRESIAYLASQWDDESIDLFIRALL
jgi:hypothetical protein